MKTTNIKTIHHSVVKSANRTKYDELVMVLDLVDVNSSFLSERKIVMNMFPYTNENKNLLNDDLSRIMNMVDGECIDTAQLIGLIIPSYMTEELLKKY